MIGPDCEAVIRGIADVGWTLRSLEPDTKAIKTLGNGSRQARSLGRLLDGSACGSQRGGT